MSELEKEKQELWNEVLSAGHPYMKCLANPKRIDERNYCVRILHEAILAGSYLSVTQVGPTDELGCPVWVPKILNR